MLFRSCRILLQQRAGVLASVLAPAHEAARADGSGVRAGRLLRLVGSTYESAVLRRPVGTLVLFEAPWCVACRALASALEELAALRARLADAEARADRYQRDSERWHEQLDDERDCVCAKLRLSKQWKPKNRKMKSFKTIAAN